MKYQIRRIFRLHKTPMTPNTMRDILSEQGFKIYIYRVGYAMEQMEELKRVYYTSNYRYDFYYWEENTDKRELRRLQDNRKAKQIPEEVKEVDIFEGGKTLKINQKTLPNLYIVPNAQINTNADDRYLKWMREGKSQEFLKRVS